jgi:hypothetical protein
VEKDKNNIKLEYRYVKEKNEKTMKSVWVFCDFNGNIVLEKEMRTDYNRILEEYLGVTNIEFPKEIEQGEFEDGWKIKSHIYIYAICGDNGPSSAQEYPLAVFEKINNVWKFKLVDQAKATDELSVFMDVL